MAAKIINLANLSQLNKLEQFLKLTVLFSDFPLEHFECLTCLNKLGFLCSQ